ncbi:GH16416 [Drosophila grimshawi]|uniref:GH16416 n=1 Tax=Drosophila grimshawi TaxID=7222 RepID=B4IZU7_DROGR|nr:GH16416 [Drosophila grimshawi]
MLTTIQLQTATEALTAGALTATATATTATVAAVTAAAAAAAASASVVTGTAATAASSTSNTEIEQLQQALLDKQTQLYALETACLRESERQLELEDSVIAWQDKYDRLYESHKRVQKVNQTLEDKMLKLVDRNTNERAQLTSDVATLSVRLAQANFNIAKLQREIVSTIFNELYIYIYSSRYSFLKYLMILSNSTRKS